MLAHVFYESIREIERKNSILAQSVHESYKNPPLPVIKSIKELLLLCQKAMSHASNIDQYNKVLDFSNVWTFYLDSQKIPYYFEKPRDKYFLNTSFIDANDDSYAIGGLSILGIARRDVIDKTVPVVVERSYAHSKYGKIMRTNKTYLVHDEFNQISEGDKVLAVECRPISKKKCFRLVRKID